MMKAAQGSNSWLKDVLIGYACMLQWIALSATVIIYNKYILFSFNFPYPITLTMLHMGFSSALSWLLVTLGAVEGVPISCPTYFRSIVPIGLIYTVVLALSNATYVHLSVSFIQMIKAATPASVYLVGVLMGLETWSLRMLFNMVIVVVGVVISAYGEINFVLIGVIFQIVAILLESFRLVLTQTLLQASGIKLNPITTLYHVAPCCFLGLLPLFFVFEFNKLKEDTEFSVTPMHLGLNAAAAFGLNCASFLLIGKTSALTMNIGGVIKDWVLIALSVFIFHNPVTRINLLGYCIAFVGVSWYNFQKIREKQLAATQQDPTTPRSPRTSETQCLIPPRKEDE